MNRCMLLSIVLYAHAIGATGDVVDQVWNDATFRRVWSAS
jgi:hypothetical protein